MFGLIAGQLLVSYLMDFEDHFTSHSYRNLCWTAFEAFINKEVRNVIPRETQGLIPHQLRRMNQVNPDTMKIGLRITLWFRMSSVMTRMRKRTHPFSTTSQNPRT
jgi:hypothetical protein